MSSYEDAAQAQIVRAEAAPNGGSVRLALDDG
jgi:hypothetical protein